MATVGVKGLNSNDEMISYTAKHTQVRFLSSTSPLGSQNLAFNSTSAKSTGHQNSITVTQLLPGLMVPHWLCGLGGRLQGISFNVLQYQSVTAWSSTN